MTKSLSKNHQEYILKRKTEQEKIDAAAEVMIERPMNLIRSILLRHEQAVIEVMSELHKERDALKANLDGHKNQAIEDFELVMKLNKEKDDLLELVKMALPFIDGHKVNSAYVCEQLQASIDAAMKEQTP